MAVYYLAAATGSDAAAGTSPTTPWQTLAKATATTLAPGDQLLLLGGSTATGNLVIADHGTSGAPIVVGTYPGPDGVTQATISATSGAPGVQVTGDHVQVSDLTVVGDDPAVDGIQWLADDRRGQGGQALRCTASGFDTGISVVGINGGGWDDVTIDSCTAHGNRLCGIFSYQWEWPPIAHHRRITIRRCTAYDNLGDLTYTENWTGSGIILSGVTDGLIDLCTAYSNGIHNGGPNGPVGIWAYEATAVTIRRCVSYNNRTRPGSADGGGFDLDIGCRSCVIEYCIAYGNDGPGVLIFSFLTDGSHTGNVVRWNLLVGNARVNDDIAEIYIGGYVSDAAVYHNTAVALPASGTPSVVRVVGAVSGADVVNNVLVATTDGATALVESGYAGVTFRGNNYWRGADGSAAVSWGGTLYDTLAAWRAVADAQEKDGANLTGRVGDPGLVDAALVPTVTDPTDLSGAAGYRLAPGSALAPAGMDIIGPGFRDLYGTALGSVRIFDPFDAAYPVTY